MKKLVRVTSVVSRRGILLSSAALAAACVTGVGDGDSGLIITDTGVDTDALPSITPNEDHYVTTYAGTPEIDTESWSLTIADRGEVLQVITYAALASLQGRDKEHTLMCISGGPHNLAIGNAVWTGLPVTELLDALGLAVPDGAVEIKFTGADDYTTSIPVADLLDGTDHGPLWLVWKMNGEAIPAEHGTICRFLTPGRYGMKNPKWPTRMEFVDTPYVGYWEQFGWSNDASYKTSGLFLRPSAPTTVPVGPVRVQGVAYAGKDPVVAVDIRVVESGADSGAAGEWQSATLEYAPGKDIWVVWSFDYDALEGRHTLQVRSTTASGRVSSDSSEGNDFLSGYDGSMEVVIEGVVE